MFLTSFHHKHFCIKKTFFSAGSSYQLKKMETKDRGRALLEDVSSSMEETGTIVKQKIKFVKPPMTKRKKRIVTLSVVLSVVISGVLAIILIICLVINDKDPDSEETNEETEETF